MRRRGRALLAAAVAAACAGCADGQNLERRAARVLPHPLARLSGDIFDPDKGPSVSTFGEVAVDAGGFAGDTGDLSYTSAALRRAKIGIEGRMVRNMGYRVVGDLSSERLNISDSYFVYRPERWSDLDATFRLGYFKPPGGVENVTSARFNGLMERSSRGQAFAPGNQYGIAGDFAWKDYGLSLGAFAASSDPETNAASGRLLAVHGYRSQRTGGVLRHVGATARYRTALGGDALRYASRLPIDLNTDPTVDTGDFGQTEAFLGLEGLYAKGPAHVLVEGGAARVEARAGGGKSYFEGLSAEAGWWLTGEAAAAGFSGGRWARPAFAAAPLGEGGYGSFQLVGGLDWVNLNGGAADGGRQLTARAGVNWWPRQHWRFAANAGFSLVRDSGGGPGSDLDVISFGLRGQRDF